MDRPVINGHQLVDNFANLVKLSGKVTGHTQYAPEIRRTFMTDNGIHQGFMFPVDGRICYSAAAPAYAYDEFHYLDTTTWDLEIGNDAQAVVAALVTGSQTGEVILTSGNAGTGIAADGSVMALPLVLEAEEGKIVLYSRMKIASAADVWFFLGFTDTLPGVTLEQPFSLSGTTYTSTASNACGFLFDTAATTDTIRIVGVEGDTDATHLDTGLAPGTAYRDYKLVLSEDGSLDAYIDGVHYAQVLNAVAPGTDLCAFAGINARTTTSKTMTLDALGYQQIPA